MAEQAGILETRRQFVLDTIPAQVWVAAPDGAITYVNQQRLDYTGLTLESALGWGWRDIFHPQDLPGLVASWRAALAAEQPLQVEARVRRFDGAAIPARDKYPRPSAGRIQGADPDFHSGDKTDPIGERKEGKGGRDR